MKNTRYPDQNDLCGVTGLRGWTGTRRIGLIKILKLKLV
jgi:hypothetical protein